MRTLSSLLVVLFIFTTSSAFARIKGFPSIKRSHMVSVETDLIKTQITITNARLGEMNVDKITMIDSENNVVFTILGKDKKITRTEQSISFKLPKAFPAGTYKLIVEKFETNSDEVERDDTLIEIH